MALRSEFDECLENIRAMEVSFRIARDMDVLLPTFFTNNFERLEKLDKELKRIKKAQSKTQNQQKIQETGEKIKSIWQKKTTPEARETPKNIPVRKKNQPATGMQEKKLGKIYDIRAYLALNDRFRFQRELFNNNTELMNVIFDQINCSASPEEALQYLESSFHWDWESDTVQLLKEILEKRFA